MLSPYRLPRLDFLRPPEGRAAQQKIGPEITQILSKCVGKHGSECIPSSICNVRNKFPYFTKSEYSITYFTKSEYSDLEGMYKEHWV